MFCNILLSWLSFDYLFDENEKIIYRYMYIFFSIKDRIYVYSYVDYIFAF